MSSLAFGNGNCLVGAPVYNTPSTTAKQPPDHTCAEKVDLNLLAGATASSILPPERAACQLSVQNAATRCRQVHPGQLCARGMLDIIYQL